MYETGTITLGNSCFDFSVKHYENPSKMGIDNGRISKLGITENGEKVCNYDRGWDIDRMSEGAKKVFEMLVGKFN